jgi:DNA-binding transcriptional LysR family regulator
VVLAAMLESNSVSEAARRLDSTQPSMSRMLDRLRDDLGDPLLIKSAHKMLPTRRAQDIRGALDDVLRASKASTSRAATTTRRWRPART